MGCGVGLGDFTRLVPNRDPSSDAELGRDWPLWRDGQSRLEGGLRRMCGLLMMDPCKRENSQMAAGRREEAHWERTAKSEGIPAADSNFKGAQWIIL